MFMHNEDGEGSTYYEPWTVLMQHGHLVWMVLTLVLILLTVKNTMQQ